MFLRIVGGSLRRRAGRVAVAALAAAMGASLVAALATLSMGVGGQAGRELRAYGANLTLAPRAAMAVAGVGGMEFGAVQEERYLAEADLATLDAWDPQELLGYAPYLSGVAEAGDRRVSLVGVRFDRVRALRPWWAVAGEWAAEGDAATSPEVQGMVGARAARRLGLQPGDLLSVRRGLAGLSIRVRGVVETGGDEEGQLFVPLPAAQTLLDRAGLVSGVEASAVAERRPLQAIAGEMERRIPGSRARVVGQIAEAEAATLEKVKLLVGLVAALVLLASGLAVAGTMAASVMERTREIGLMKALGAGNGRIARLFLAEAVAIALLGGVPGFLLGIALAEVIGRAVFGVAVAPSPLAAPVTLVAVLAVCLLAGALPVRRALLVDPAVTLRGE